MSLTDYVTLGRSGLRVSPLSLGTMTFGTEWGWGSDETQAREIFDQAYIVDAKSDEPEQFRAIGWSRVDCAPSFSKYD